MAERKSAMIAKKKILVCDRFSIEALIQLKTNPQFEVVSVLSESELQHHLSSAHGLLIRSKQKINSSFLDAAKNLEVITTCTSGYDHIDLVETEKRRLCVMYTPEANQISAAEMTWTLLLACARHVIPAHRDIKAGKWQRDPYLGFELAGKTLGIVGLGRIGSRVAKMAAAFSMEILAFDPYQDDPVFESVKATRVSYDELLKQCDILSFHVPATKETKHMFNRNHYELVSHELVLINTSRGSAINEDDLFEALNSGKIKAAGLDVFEKEPLSHESKLMKCPQVIFTPHLGAFTEEAFQKASLQGALQIENYFKTKKIQNSLPLVNLWGSLSFQEGT